MNRLINNYNSSKKSQALKEISDNQNDLNALSDSDDENDFQSNNVLLSEEKLNPYIVKEKLDNKKEIDDYLLSLKDCILNQQGRNSVIGNNSPNYKDIIQNISFSCLSNEVSDFLKEINEDIFVVVHINISRKVKKKKTVTNFGIQRNKTGASGNSSTTKRLIKEIKNEASKFRILDYIANSRTKNGFEYNYREFLKKTFNINSNVDNSNDNNENNESQPNSFENSLSTIYCGAKNRNISKEKVIFLDADYNEIINQDRYDVLNLLFLISSCIIVNCLYLKDENNKTQLNMNNNMVINNPLSNFFHQQIDDNANSVKIIENFISTVKDSIKTNIQYKVRSNILI